MLPPFPKRKMADPKIFRGRSVCCNNLATAERVLVTVECVVGGVGLVGCLASAWSGGAATGAATGLGIAITLTAVLLLHKGVRAGTPQRLLPYLVWKPIQVLMEAASLVFYALAVRTTWTEAEERTAEEMGLPSNSPEREHMDHYFLLVYGVVLALSAAYLLLGLFFVFVAWRWRQELLAKEAPIPLISYNCPPMEMRAGGEKAVFLPTVMPPSYDEAVYAPTVEKA